MRYIGVHQELFGRYEGVLMKKPSMEVLERTQGSFLEFLTREDLLPLVPAFTLAHTVPGYGYLDEVKAIGFKLNECLTHCSPGVCNIWLDLEHSQICGEHNAADTEARQKTFQRLCSQTGI